MMLRQMCIGKLHRVRVTDANPDYVGSITIGKELIRAAGFLPGELVHINNLSNGAHWETYILEGETGQIVLNGPPSRLFQKGDIVVVFAVGLVFDQDAKKTRPTVVFVDKKNRITKVKKGKRPK